MHSKCNPEHNDTHIIYICREDVLNLNIFISACVSAYIYSIYCYLAQVAPPSTSTTSTKTPGSSGKKSAATDNDDDGVDGQASGQQFLSIVFVS